MAAGELVSSLAAGALSYGITLGTLIALCQFLSGLSLALVALVQQTWAAAVGLTLLGLFSAPLTIWAQTLRMDIIPAELRGRAFALLRMLMQSANPLGVCWLDPCCRWLASRRRWPSRPGSWACPD